LFKIRLHLIPELLATFTVFLMICGAYPAPVFGQQSNSSQPASAQNRAAEVVSLCNPNKVDSYKSEGKTTYTCEGKRPAPRQGAASRYKDASARGPRAGINCSYSETGGDMKWLACTCTADEDSKCIGFISWCAAQGDEVSGNSGSASCVPGG